MKGSLWLAKWRTFFPTATKKGVLRRRHLPSYHYEGRHCDWPSERHIPFDCYQERCSNEMVFTFLPLWRDHCDWPSEGYLPFHCYQERFLKETAFTFLPLWMEALIGQAKDIYLFTATKKRCSKEKVFTFLPLWWEALWLAKWKTLTFSLLPRKVFRGKGIYLLAAAWEGTVTGWGVLAAAHHCGCASQLAANWLNRQQRSRKWGQGHPIHAACTGCCIQNHTHCNAV